MDPLFDVAALDDYELGHLEYIMNHPSYLRVFRPFLERVEQTYVQLALDPRPDVRRKHGGTKYLRAGANNIRNVLDFFDKIVAETQHQRAMGVQLTDQEQYHAAVERGQAGPNALIPDYAEVQEF
jgi:hypothetical protein